MQNWNDIPVSKTNDGTHVKLYDTQSRNRLADAIKRGDSEIQLGTNEKVYFEFGSDRGTQAPQV